jgi:periplasmic divalent cation tolerance protein
LPDRETVEKIAAAVVAERLAACAHVRGPIDSWYRWQGNAETAQEWEADAVTTAAMSGLCIARIRGMHPYQLPAMLVAELTTSAEYASWVRANTH